MRFEELYVRGIISSLSLLTVLLSPLPWHRAGSCSSLPTPPGLSLHRRSLPFRAQDIVLIPAEFCRVPAGPSLHPVQVPALASGASVVLSNLVSSANFMSVPLPPPPGHCWKCHTGQVPEKKSRGFAPATSARVWAINHYPLSQTSQPLIMRLFVHPSEF